VQKIIKRISAIAIATFRRRDIVASGNALGLIATGYILYSHFRADKVGHLVFENEWLSFLAEWGICALPVLLLLNSFLFRRVWKTTVSAVVSSILTSYVLLALFLIGTFGGFNDTSLVRQTRTPDGQIVSLYERRESGGFSPGDSERCRYRIRRSYVFRGVLRTEDRGKEVCHRNEDGLFPPELQ
jgi:hypothetical protein